MRGSFVGGREFLGHARAYLEFYEQEEAQMFAPLLEALSRDPPALVVADRRALAAFRACKYSGIPCAMNCAGLLDDLDHPPSSLPAPFTGFPLGGQTLAHRLHSHLIRLVLALARLQVSRQAGRLPTGQQEDSPSCVSWGIGLLAARKGCQVAEQRLVLADSSFGSMEHPRMLPPRVHMVGPLWVGMDQPHVWGQHVPGERGRETPW
ncbi:unnamed protein product, partial [Discosporangium mesarthrocarpum]